MKFKLISFDLQGTLCDHAFSSEVWLTLLPEVFKAQKSNFSEKEYRKLLSDFQNIRQDDRRYYDLDYWLERCGSNENTVNLARRAVKRPYIFPEMRKLIKRLSPSAELIIVSATTQKFIKLETGDWAGAFQDIYSTFDDFGVAGKPPAVFSSIAKRFGLSPCQCLHVGDHPEMDAVSPKVAGWQSCYDASEVTPANRVKRILNFLQIYD